MDTYELREDEGELLRLVRQAAKGTPLVLSSNGEPLAEVVPIRSSPDRPSTRLGFLKGETEVPEDFDRLFADQIVDMFEARD